MVDRFGPVPILVVSNSASALATIAWAFSKTELQATAASLITAFFGAASWGPASTLLARLAPEDIREKAFGINFMMLNLGIGLGLLTSAAVVDLLRPVTFTILYLVSAGGSILSFLLILTLRQFGGPVSRDLESSTEKKEGWLTVLRDKRIRWYLIATLVLAIGGYSSLDAGFSLYVVNILKLPVHVIGLIFVFNTTTIVLVQVRILNRVKGLERSRVLAFASVLWFLFWFVTLVARYLPPALAVTSMCVAVIIFAIGEAIIIPVGQTLVNEIAPENLRGRYNVAWGLAWGISNTIAPAFAALFFVNHIGRWWPLGAGSTSLAGASMMLFLHRHLKEVEPPQPSK
jgi:MFS family permease